MPFHATERANAQSTGARKSGFGRALTRIVLGPDPERHLNVKITLGGQIGYLCCLGLIWYFTHFGLMDPHLGWPVALSVIASMLAFYAMLRFGWSRRLRDPGMTVAQMMNATVFSAVAYIVVPQAHIGLLMPVATTLAYSAFALRHRSVIYVQAFNVVVFSVTSAVMCLVQPLHYRPEVEIFVLGILAVSVIMLTWSGSQIAEMRQRQRRQRDELTEALSRIEDLAIRDALTGLYNRTHMKALLAHSAERVQRHDSTVTLALIDLDHLKAVNDTYGHGVGDDVLKSFARVAQGALDGTETLARWGGEEFLLFSTRSTEQVRLLLDQIRGQLAHTAASSQVPALRASFSAGVASYAGGETTVDTIARADRALYQAKAAGRSRTCIASAVDSRRNAGVESTLAHTASQEAGLSRADSDVHHPNATLSTIAPHSMPPIQSAGGMPPQNAESTRFAWLLGRDARQRRAVGRTLVGMLPYVVSLFGLVYAAQIGQMAPLTANVLFCCFSLTAILLYAIVRSGCTRNFEDPTITMVQVLLGINWAVALYATTAAMHSAQLMVLVMVMTVAVCNMRWRHAWIACGYALLTMTATMFVMSQLRPDIYDPRIEFANWILMAFNLPTVMLMGPHLTKLRLRLREQRVQLKEAVERIGQMAARDELTGLSNRSHMDEMLAHYIRRRDQSGEMFSVALIDLDNFKRINDTHGHAVGDEVLRRFAHHATETLRHIDLIARWGGEEFLVLCPKSDADQALIGLERLRRVFSTTELSASVQNVRASFSAGVTTPRSGEPITVTLAHADRALYDAKRMGGNRICVHESILQPGASTLCANPPSVA